MKLKINSNKGMSLATIVISIILMIIILSSIILSVNKTSETKAVMQLNSDIEELTRRVKLYYLENGIVPIDEKNSDKYTDEEYVYEGKDENGKIVKNDVIFYRIPLSIFDNLNLINQEKLNDYDGDGSYNIENCYAINRETHLICYVKNGEIVKGKYSEGYSEIIKQANLFEVFKEEQDDKYVDIQSGEILTFSISGEEATVTGLTEYGKSIPNLELVIPKYYKGKPVTKIGYVVAEDGYYGAFYNCTNIKKVDLGNVSEIKDIPKSSENRYYGAFRNCTNLSEVKMSNIKIIGSFAFENCSSLSGVIEFPETITDIHQYAFEYCTNIKKVVIPDGKVRTLGSNAFYYCSALEEIQMKGIQTIGSRAFLGCKNLQKVELDFNEKICIQLKAFYGCANLIMDVTDLKLDQTTIDTQTFWQCQNFTGTLDLSNISEVGTLAFYNCYNLDFKADENGNKLSNIQKLGDGAFKASGISGTIHFKSIQIIPSAAFNSCGKIEKVILESVEKIEDAGEDTEGYQDTGAFAKTKITSLEIRADSAGKIKLTRIGTYAFYMTNYLENIEIPSAVTVIEKCAFGLYSGDGGAIKRRHIYCPGNSSKPNDWDPNWAQAVENIYWDTSMPTT